MMMTKMSLFFAVLLTICAGVTALVAQSEPNVIYLPLLNNAPSVDGLSSPEPTALPPALPTSLTVTGGVLSTGSAMTTASVVLVRYQPGVDVPSRPVGVVSWESAGSQSFTYEFNNVDLLAAGEAYYILFVNPDKTTGILDSWFTADFGNPATGNVVTVATFDAADVTLRDPDDGASKSLPENFKWNERGTNSDQYSLQLYETNADGQIVRSATSELLPHPNDNYNVGSIAESAGFLTDVAYRWRVRVHDGIGGFGIPLESRQITFKDFATVAANRAADNRTGDNHISYLLAHSTRNHLVSSQQQRRDR